MADEVKNGLSADSSRIASKWNRNTVADGSWLQKYTLNPLTARDYYLASAIDALGSATDDTTSALSAAISSVSSIHDEYINYLSATISGDISGYINYVSGSVTALSGDLKTSADELLRLIDEEHGRADDAETKINNRLDNMEAATDVINVYGSWDDFTDNSGDLFTLSGITDNDIIKILNDKNSYPNEMFPGVQPVASGHQTYFRWINSAIPKSAHIKPLDPTSGYWNFIGYVDPYYTTTEIDEYLNELSATVSDNYLSANENAVSAGKNIQIIYDENKPKITINTKDDVEFNNVSSKNVSATNVTALTAQGNSAKFTNLSSTKLNNVVIDNLFGSAYSGADASAYITSHSADFLNSAHSAYGKLKFGTKEYPATNSSYNFTINAGQEINFTTGDNQVTIGATDNLITSANAGSAASAWVSSHSAGLNIQGGYGISTGTNENGNLVINIRNNGCDYAAYGLALGENSTAIGAANGPNAFAFGDYCYAHGANAFAAGCHSTAGKFAVAMGWNNVATGDYSLALGYNSTAERAYTVAIGRGLSGEAPITLGTWNDNVAGATFIIGDGTGTQEGHDVVRKNALVIKDGLVSARDFSAGNVSLSSLTNISAFGNGITNTATFNLSAVKLSAGQGIGFKNDTNGVLSISAEGRAYTGENYVKVDNTTKKISLSGDLVNSAQSGQSAYNWITTKSATLSAGQGIKFTSAATNTLGIGLDTDNFSASNISALNFYIPSANDGARSVSEISSNSTGVSAHIVEEMVNKVVTASWRSIIDAANAANEYVPLTAEKCTIGDDNNAYDNSLAQGSNNTAENQSLAQGCLNEAHSNSLAQGSNNSANSCSFAQGYYNSAESYSLAFGTHSQAHQGGFAFSPYLWGTQTKPSLASGNSFAFGNGCTAEINSFAMGSNCSAITGGFAYGTDCTAASNSIAMGVGMVSKTKQISLGYYGLIQSGATNNVVFHVGYGLGPEDENRRDVFRVTSAGAIASFNAGYANPQPAEVLLTNEFFQAPRQFGRRIPMRLSQGLEMGNGLNLNIKTYPAAFTATHNIIFGDDAEGYCFNMWIPDTTASQEFTLTKAASIHRGVYRLSIGVDKNYSIIFKNFEPNTGSQSNHTVIKTGTNVTGSWPNGGTNATYDYSSFFLDKEQATSNTYFNFPAIPCDDVITFIVDGATKQFIMIKGHS